MNIKYMAVIVLASIALAITAYSLLALADTPVTAPPQSASDFIYISRDKATREQCLQSCTSSFPDKYSVQYRACTKGCK